MRVKIKRETTAFAKVFQATESTVWFLPSVLGSKMPSWAESLVGAGDERRRHALLKRGCPLDAVVGVEVGRERGREGETLLSLSSQWINREWPHEEFFAKTGSLTARPSTFLSKSQLHCCFKAALKPALCPHPTQSDPSHPWAVCGCMEVGLIRAKELPISFWGLWRRRMRRRRDGRRKRRALDTGLCIK